MEFNDRRSWKFTTPGDADWNTPLDHKTVKEANKRLRSEDMSDQFGMPYNVTNRAISRARKGLRLDKQRAAEEGVDTPRTVGEYMTRAQNHLMDLVHQDVYNPKRGIR